MPPAPLLLWQQTMVPGPVVMPAPQTVVPPQRRPAPAVEPASNSAATRDFTPRQPARPAACFQCGQRGHIRRDCPTTGAAPWLAASQATASPDGVQMASDGDGKKLARCVCTYSAVWPQGYCVAGQRQREVHHWRTPSATGCESKAHNARTFASQWYVHAVGR